MRTTVIAGLGPNSEFGFALTERLLVAGHAVAVLARDADTLKRLSSGASDRLRVYQVDLTDSASVTAAVDQAERELSSIEVYIHNAASLVRGRFLDLDVEAYRNAWRSSVETALVTSGVLMPRFVERGRGVAIFTGATAATRGAAGFGAFAAAKFALRGLAQSLARELGPEGVHVVHVIVDGVIWGSRAEHEFRLERAACIEPEALSEAYLQLIEQPASCWSHELDVRPATERF